jgi:hypothetical protein
MRTKEDWISPETVEGILKESAGWKAQAERLAKELGQARGMLAILLGNNDANEQSYERWAMAWAQVRLILAKDP